MNLCRDTTNTISQYRPQYPQRPIPFLNTTSSILKDQYDQYHIQYSTNMSIVQYHLPFITHITIFHYFQNQPRRDFKVLMPFFGAVVAGWRHEQPYIRTAVGGNGAFGTWSEMSQS